MDPYIATIRASAEALKAVFDWLQTPEGQATSKSMREDRAAWDAFWAAAGKRFEKLPKGLPK